MKVVGEQPDISANNFHDTLLRQIADFALFLRFQQELPKEDLSPINSNVKSLDDGCEFCLGLVKSTTRVAWL